MYSFFECCTGLLADEMSDDTAVATVENRFRHAAAPLRIHAAIERIDVNAGLLAIIGEAGVIAGKEAANEIHVGIVVEADAKNRETLRSILFFELNEQRKFVAARFAPRGPKGDDERFAAVLRENLVVAGEVNKRQIGCGRFGGFCCGLGGGCLRGR